LFYVGDVKQAIFGWRGGDAALFNDIRFHYNSLQPDSIQSEHMEDSRRSGPALMEAVNRIFGDFDRLRSLFPDHPEFVERWETNWAPHTTHHQNRADYVELLTLADDPTAEEDASERRLAVVAGLVEEIAPHRKQLSCAILVRTNDTAIALANAIRARTDVPVTVDSDTLIGTDHPIASSFLSLLQFTAHPGDSATWKHLLMTPAFCLQNWEGYRTLRRSLGRELLTTIHDAGFAQAFELWLTYLQNGGFVPDAFARRRIEQLRQAVHDFDQKGNRSIADFIHYAEAAATRETPANGVVQIMTIHKSKGLGFDVVILTDLDRHNNPAITTTQQLSLVAHERGAGLDREIDWVLSMPNQQVCEMDARLLEARHRCEIDRAYEELCVLYVALTRAKFATHIVCSEPKTEPKGSARDLLIAALAQARDAAPQRTLAEETVSVLYAGGDPNWHAARPRPATTEEPLPSIPAVHRTRRFPPLQRAMPSSAAEEGSHGKSKTSLLFSRTSSAAATYGTKLHAIFEAIDWIDGLAPGELEEAVAARIDPAAPVEVQVQDEVLAALREPAIASLFRRANFGPNPTLWREKRFEIILNGAWVSGTFDRVVLTSERAWIFDFKTNRVATPEQIAEARNSYQPQLAVYREALSRLSGIPTGAIETRLIFTKPAVVV
jgi:ATP-dependent exoDNAse (exonuclease V) beta subunit